MRKSDREIVNFKEILDVIEKCDTMRLGMNGGDYPYVVPLSFGYDTDGERGLVLYFHCATEGKKLEYIEKDNRVCAEFDLLNKYVDRGSSVTADYESVICFGRAYECTDGEKVTGLKRLLAHCGMEHYSAEECAALPIVKVYKVVTECVTGKKRFK